MKIEKLSLIFVLIQTTQPFFYLQTLRDTHQHSSFLTKIAEKWFISVTMIWTTSFKLVVEEHHSKGLSWICLWQETEADLPILPLEMFRAKTVDTRNLSHSQDTKNTIYIFFILPCAFKQVKDDQRGQISASKQQLMYIAVNKSLNELQAALDH